MSSPRDAELRSDITCKSDNRESRSRMSKPYLEDRQNEFRQTRQGHNTPKLTHGGEEAGSPGFPRHWSERSADKFMVIGRERSTGPPPPWAEKRLPRSIQLRRWPRHVRGGDRRGWRATSLCLGIGFFSDFRFFCSVPESGSRPCPLTGTRLPIPSPRNHQGSAVMSVTNFSFEACMCMTTPPFSGTI